MGFVVNFIRFPAVQTFENWLRFDRITESLKVETFLRHSVDLQHSVQRHRVGTRSNSTPLRQQ